MKALISLIGLIALGLAIAWFGFGIHPQVVYNRLVGSMVSGTSEQAGEISNTSSRLKEVAGQHLGEAQDVYNGKIDRDDPFAPQTK